MVTLAFATKNQESRRRKDLPASSGDAPSWPYCESLKTHSAVGTEEGSHSVT